MEITTETTTDESTIRLRGDFDVRSTQEVRDAIYEQLLALDLGTDLVIDCSQVSSVDVTALKVLAAATHYAEREGRRVRLRGCPRAVRRMLHLSRLIRAVEVERVATPA